MAIRFATGTDKLKLEVASLDLRRTEVLEDREGSPFAQFAGDRLGQLDAAADGNDVNIFRMPIEENIPHIAADDVGFQAQFVCGFGDEAERRR